MAIEVWKDQLVPGASRTPWEIAQGLPPQGLFNLPYTTDYYSTPYYRSDWVDANQSGTLDAADYISGSGDAYGVGRSYYGGQGVPTLTESLPLAQMNPAIQAQAQNSLAAALIANASQGPTMGGSSGGGQPVGGQPGVVGGQASKGSAARGYAGAPTAKPPVASPYYKGSDALPYLYALGISGKYKTPEEEEEERKRRQRREYGVVSE